MGSFGATATSARLTSGAFLTLLAISAMYYDGSLAHPANDVVKEQRRVVELCHGADRQQRSESVIDIQVGSAGGIELQITRHGCN